nr:hypothetical protein [Tanacetum cinerariifolium]
MFIEFVIQNQFFSYCLEEFAQILNIPCKGQAYHIRHEEEIDAHEHRILTREIVPTMKPLEEIIEENVFCLGVLCLVRSCYESSYRSSRAKTSKDHGTRRGRYSTSSSSAFDQPSSSHLNDDDDGNDEGTSRTSTLFPIRFVNSLTNDVP